MVTSVRLLIATPLYPPDPGGPATYAHIVAQNLPQQGISVEVVSFGDVRHLPKIVRHIAYFRQLLRASKLCDTILALDPVSVGLPALLVATLTKKRFMVKIVGDYAWEQGRQRFGVKEGLDEFVHLRNVSFPVSLLRKVQTYVAKSASRIIVPSLYLKRIVSVWGIPETNISVVYNAIPKGEKGICPEELTGLKDPLVLCVSRLVPWKHVDGVIDAVGGVTAQGLSLTLAVVGSGPLEHQLCKQAKESDALCMMLGARDREGTDGAFEAADIFVLNSSYEGLSHVLIEALVHGKTIIATEAGGNPELIKDGVNGLLIPVNDTPALTRALIRLIENPDLRAKLQEGALASAGDFGGENMITKTSELLAV